MYVTRMIPLGSLVLISALVGCTGTRHVAPVRDDWRRVYVTSEEKGQRLIIWDFTDPDRFVVRDFSFQPNTYRTWAEYELPSEPGTVWEGTENGGDPPAR